MAHTVAVPDRGRRPGLERTGAPPLCRDLGTAWSRLVWEHPEMAEALALATVRRFPAAQVAAALGLDEATVERRERAGLGLLAAWWGRGVADVRQALQ